MTSWAERSGRRCRAQAPVESGDVDVDIVSRTHHEGHTTTRNTTSNTGSSDLDVARLLLESSGALPRTLRTVLSRAQQLLSAAQAPLSTSATNMEET